MNMTDILDYLDRRLGSSIHSGDEHVFWCPVCIDKIGSEGRKRSLSVNPSKPAGYCFRCEYGFYGWTNLFREINGGHLRLEEMELLDSKPSLVEGLTVRESVVLTLWGPKVEKPVLQPVALPPEAVRLADAPKDFRTRVGRDYLEGRGIHHRFLSLFDIHYCNEGEYRQRLIFPVIQGGGPVYFTSRYAGNDVPNKSKNPPNVAGHFTRKECLLNYDSVVGAEMVAVVEGPFDCMAYRHAVALMGKVISDAQVALLEALVPFGLQEIVVSLDPDAAADAEKVYYALDGRVPKVTILRLDHGDPHDRRGELAGLLNTRRPVGILDQVSSRLKRG